MRGGIGHGFSSACGGRVRRGGPTLSGGVSGTMPWPRLNTNGRPAIASQIASMRASRARPPDDEQQRIEIALHDFAGSRDRLHDAQRAGRIAADAIDARSIDVCLQECCRAARKAYDRNLRVMAANSGTMRAVGLTTQRSNSSSARLPAQLSKICSALAPASTCPRKVGNRRFGQQIDELAEKPAGSR